MRQEEYQKEGSTVASAACRRFDAELGTYLEGEDRPEVIAHARECRACSALLSDMQQVISTSALLGYEDPPRRLWANIRASLAAEGLLSQEAALWKRWLPALALFRPAPVAALGCLALLSSLLVTPSQILQSHTDFLQQPNAMTQVSAPETEVADKGLEETVRQLQNTYQGRAVSFQPAVKAAYQRSLTSLDSSIAECRDSVRREPTNSLAREYLLAAYQEKAEVLQSALEYDGR
jgi:hypothetical protein